VLIGAWHPHGVSGLILVDPSVTSPPGERESLGARSLRECPPDWTALRASLKCDVLEVHGDDPTLVDRVEAFVSARLP
jgi:hypothetical protein